ncbi:MAG: ParB/RepB/Spo0J family partition protein, partial [Cellulomonadaceae bacterium]|nr:ParB/RepB/Spo0J family partition protein [Cellulomonadaceae bacterium]
MAEKRRGLGRGLGALIPSAPSGDARPVDVFFPGAPLSTPSPVVVPAERGAADADGSATTDGIAASSAEANGATTSVAEGHAAGGTLVQPRPASGDNGVTVDGTGVPRETSTTPGSPQGPVLGTTAQDAADEDPHALLPVPGAHFAELPVTSIVPNPRQPRTIFDEDALAELVGSIREIGVLQPLVVRPADVVDGVATYELIMGERRWRATQLAGLATIPTIVRETDDADLLRDALLENLHRSELNALEEAAAYQQLLDDFGCTHEELARRIHRSRPQISNTLRLLRL